MEIERLKAHDKNIQNNFFQRAFLIRRFEERLLKLFAEGKLNGTVHTCLGQELSGLAVAAATCSADVVYSNHRGHGHYLAFHDNPEGLLSEIMGRRTGICGGMGGSQHLHDTNFFSNGILGGMSPVAVGSAWARKQSGRDGMSIVFHGDGALGEGVIYEAMNLAARWELPVLWVVERNGYAQSTDCRQTMAGEVAARAAGFGLRHFEGDTWTIGLLAATAVEAVQFVRENSRPAMLEIATYRLAAHSKGDDNREPAELERFRNRDPLNCFLFEHPELACEWQQSVASRLDAAQSAAEAAPVCSFHPVWSPRVPVRMPSWRERVVEPDGERYSSVLYEVLKEHLAAEPNAVIIGEDIEGPYGGAFKVTRDLSQLFPGRVRNTPISEAAITGVGTGAAMEGKTAIVEIMFGDFLTLVFDQLLQHACKFRTMFGDKMRVPLILRAPMGGRRGYGPTHSQSIESHFLGMPELDVVALNARIHPGMVFGPILKNGERPALVVENKIVYTRQLRKAVPAGYRCYESDEPIPCIRLAPIAGQPECTVVCYGGMLEEAEEALRTIFDDEEMLIEIVCPTQLVPFSPGAIVESVRRTKRLVIAEEGKSFAAFGSEVLAEIASSGVSCEVKRLGNDHIIPSSFAAETELLPDARRIAAAIKELTDA